MNETIIIAAAASALLLYALFIIVKRRLLQSSQRQNRYKQKKIARDLLDIAVSQRSIFSIESTLPEAYGNNPRGPCLQITPQCLFVSVGDSASTLNLVGERVKVFFSISHKRKPAFYQFQSEVLDLKSRGAIQSLRLSLPEKMDTGQKRNFVRVTPQPTAVQALGLWPLEKDAPLPVHYGDLEGATFHFRPGKIHELTLENISAGGMRLKITATEDQYEKLVLRKNSRLLLLVVLRSDENDNALPFWLECRIRLVDEAPDKEGCLTTGLSFCHWAMMELGKNVPIGWFPVDSNGGVSPLASWVMRHHLEQHKIL